MDQLALPVFPAFDADVDKSTVGPRWDRWVGRLENLFVALKLVDPIVPHGEQPDAAVVKSIDDRKRALYCITSVNKLLTFMRHKRGTLKLHSRQLRKS